MTPLTKKLRLKAGMRARFINPPPGYVELVGELPTGVVEAAMELDFVQLFAKDGAELAALWPEAHKAIKYDGMLWICYPKKSSGIGSDLNRDAGWKPVTESGLRPVAGVSIDATWTALRFRPVEAVKTK